ncbi:hypothetical protein J4Q44_G00051260 [Coregonus suidteri]|uniref:Pyrroline-5-carboxylate reductase catalytic N-terminal domain-containing protein n=1 Tax=Coregonus suidteri TaxID=861788 RepID=A0AAN8MA68_9TELE
MSIGQKYTDVKKGAQDRMPQEKMKKPLIWGGASPSPRHLKTSISDPGTPLVGILGTGDFSRSLATGLVASLFPEEAEVTTQHQAATQADLVFVALFPEHYSTLAGLREPLVGKILVDVSNGTKINRDKQSYAEQLADIFPESSVVKGFNVISAWSLQTGPRDGSRQVRPKSSEHTTVPEKRQTDRHYYSE